MKGEGPNGSECAEEDEHARGDGALPCIPFQTVKPELFQVGESTAELVHKERRGDGHVPGIST